MQRTSTSAGGLFDLGAALPGNAFVNAGMRVIGNVFDPAGLTVEVYNRPNTQDSAELIVRLASLTPEELLHSIDTVTDSSGNWAAAACSTRTCR